MNKVHKYLILFVGFLYLNNCSTMNLEDYKNNNPKLVLENFFSGKTVARGVFEDRFGNIKKYFKVDIVGTWNGKTLILEENFVYNDGSKENSLIFPFFNSTTSVISLIETSSNPSLP